MPQYDVEMTYIFEGIVAATEGEAIEICDEAIGCVIATHPTTGEDLFAFGVATENEPEPIQD